MNARARWTTAALSFALCSLTACGGSGDGASGSGTSSSSGASATAPAITAQPANQRVALGATATFSVTASGSTPLSYQWQRNGAAIAGATAASYTSAASVVGDDGAKFSVTVSNSAGSVTSGNATLSVTGGVAAAGTDVLTYKNDPMRSGLNATETTLTQAAVASGKFALLRNLPVDGKVDAQPLYLSQFSIAGAAHDVIIAATEHNSVYAFDADTGSVLWQRSLLIIGESLSDVRGCSQVTPEIGITSTPVIDRSRALVYVVTMSKDTASAYHQRLHALNLGDGSEALGGPVDISATYPGAGGTTVSFSPGQYEERAALLLLNGTLYTSWTSHCDIAPYSGWVIAFSATTLARTAVLNVAPNSSSGPAIWMSGGGPAADADGNVYLLTANGAFETTLDANGFPNKQDYGNSFLKLAINGSNLGVTDYFALSNTVAESQSDQDLGSGGEMLLPDLLDSGNVVRHLVVGAGKDGHIYLVDRDSMGKFSVGANAIWQQASNAVSGGVWATPAYFNGTIYYGPNSGTLKAFTLVNAKLVPTPASQSSSQFAYPGTAPSVSANGTLDGIVWAHENSSSAILHAYDAADLSHELYSSNQAANARDHFGSGNKFITPTVADGRVLVGTTNSVAVFGLQP